VGYVTARVITGSVEAYGSAYERLTVIQSYRLATKETSKMKFLKMGSQSSLRIPSESGPTLVRGKA
jgi:hypothetical protein